MENITYQQIIQHLRELSSSGIGKVKIYSLVISWGIVLIIRVTLWLELAPLKGFWENIIAVLVWIAGFLLIWTILSLLTVKPDNQAFENFPSTPPLVKKSKIPKELGRPILRNIISILLIVILLVVYSIIVILFWRQMLSPQIDLISSGLFEWTESSIVNLGVNIIFILIIVTIPLMALFVYKPKNINAILTRLADLRSQGADLWSECQSKPEEEFDVAGWWARVGIWRGEVYKELYKIHPADATNWEVVVTVPLLSLVGGHSIDVIQKLSIFQLWLSKLQEYINQRTR